MQHGGGPLSHDHLARSDGARGHQTAAHRLGHGAAERGRRRRRGGSGSSGRRCSGTGSGRTVRVAAVRMAIRVAVAVCVAVCVRMRGTAMRMSMSVLMCCIAARRSAVCLLLLVLVLGCGCSSGCGCGCGVSRCGARLVAAAHCRVCVVVPLCRCARVTQRRVMSVAHCTASSDPTHRITPRHCDWSARPAGGSCGANPADRCSAHDADHWITHNRPTPPSSHDKHGGNSQDDGK